MTTTEEQEMNFRAILELDDPMPAPQASVSPSAAAASPAKMKKEVPEAQEDSTVKSDDRKSIKISRRVHSKLKLLSFWMDREGVMDNPGISELIEDALGYYLEARYPDAKEFVNRNM